MTARYFCACLFVLGLAPAFGATPAITGIDTRTEGNRIDAGGPHFNLFVMGSGFTDRSFARLGGTPLTTLFIANNTLHIVIEPHLRAKSGRFNLTITNPGEGTSNPWPLHISPVLFTVSAGVALVGSTTRITATGDGFVGGDVLVLTVSGQQTPLPTTVVDLKSLEAVIPASAMLGVGSGTIEVYDQANDVQSLQLPFLIEAQPAITALSPNSVNAGGGYFLLTVTGTGFSPACGAKLGEIGLNTTCLSPTQLTADVPTELRTLSGTFNLTVTGAAGIPSAPFPLRVSPVLVSVTPSSVLAGGPAVTVTATGIGFTPKNALALTVGGQTSRLPTTYISSTGLSAMIPAAALSGPQTASIQVVNTAGPDVSAALPFAIRGAPTIVSVTPNPMDAGGQSLVMTVAGAGFSPASVLNWNGAPLGTSFSGANQLTATLTPSLRALSGTFPLTVTDDGGIASAPFPVTISPVLFSISPSSAAALSPALTITASGAGLTAGNILTFNSQPVPTTYVSSTTLTAVIPAAALTNPGTSSIQIVDSTGSGRSQTRTFTVTTPTPEISSLSPNEVAAAGPGFSLRVSGSGFYSGSAVQWNGTAIATTFGTSSALTATVPAALVQSPGTAAITVSNAGTVSNSVSLTIGPAPAATLDRVSPAAATVGGPAFTLTVNGSGFLAGSIVQWNSAQLATAYRSAAQITAIVPAALLTDLGVASIAVANPGGNVSNHLSFRIDPPRPAVSGLTPSTAPAGAPALTIAVTGDHFAPNCEVRWNDAPLASARVSETLLTATVPSGLLAVAGGAAITVANPSGMVSLPATFMVTVSSPAITALSPAAVAVGSAAFTLSVYGYNFANSAVVQWNGAPLTTTFVSATQLTAAVPASLTASAAAVEITVRNPGDLISRAALFTVTAPPSVTAIVNAFSSLPAAAPGSLISIYGSSLAAPDAMPVVRIDGIRLPILFASSAQINAQAPFEVSPGEVALTVETGGLRSAPAKLEVKAAAPGILLVPGTDRALAQDAIDGTLIGPQNPAVPGRYVTVYVTGQGNVNPPVATGDAAPTDPLSLPLAEVRASVGDKPATVTFAGLAPGFLGLLQINLLVPDVAAGDQPLSITVGDVSANRATLPVAN